MVSRIGGISRPTDQLGCRYIALAFRLKKLKPTA
jgi:hypothetical protein